MQENDFVNVNDVPVVTVQYFWSMIISMSNNHDRTRSIAKMGCFLGAVSLAVNIITLVLISKGLL